MPHGKCSHTNITYPLPPQQHLPPAAAPPPTGPPATAKNATTRGPVDGEMIAEGVELAESHVCQGYRVIPCKILFLRGTEIGGGIHRDQRTMSTLPQSINTRGVLTSPYEVGYQLSPHELPYLQSLTQLLPVLEGHIHKYHAPSTFHVHERHPAIPYDRGRRLLITPRWLESSDRSIPRSLVIGQRKRRSLDKTYETAHGKYWGLLSNTPSPYQPALPSTVSLPFTGTPVIARQSSTRGPGEEGIGIGIAIAWVLPACGTQNFTFRAIGVTSAQILFLRGTEHIPVPARSAPRGLCYSRDIMMVYHNLHLRSEYHILREAAAEGIDMYTLDLEGKAIQHAEDRAGIMLAHDKAVNVSFMNTEQFFEQHAKAGQHRGIRGLRKSGNDTSTDARQGGQKASQRDTAANGSDPTPSHVPPGTQAGKTQGAPPESHRGSVPPAEGSGATVE